jgi:hypothetical protein
MICVHVLYYLMRGWQLVRMGDRPHLLISKFENLSTTLITAHYTVAFFGVEHLPTMEQFLDDLETQCEREEE